MKAASDARSGEQDEREGPSNPGDTVQEETSLKGQVLRAVKVVVKDRAAGFCGGLVHDTSDDNEENNHEHVSQVEQQLGNAEQWFYANTTSNKDVKEHHSSTELRYHVELGGNVGEAIAAERLDDTSI